VTGRFVTARRFSSRIARSPSASLALRGVTGTFGMKQSFHWNEDLNESLNYWFWLRRVGSLADETTLIDHARHTLGLSAYEGHLAIQDQARFSEYLMAWRDWKRDQAKIQTAPVPPKGLRAQYRAVAAIGVKPFTIQWVMADFGDRWVLPPCTVILGADGGTPEERRWAIVEAAKAIAAA
jgi:hypothetical protein